MRRVESVGYTGKYRNRVVRTYSGNEEGKGARRLAFFLVVVGLVLPLVPQLLGDMIWLGHWAVRITLLITSIVIMTKGFPFRGCLGILVALLVLPVWLLMAPLVIRMATDERGWRQVLKEEGQRGRDLLQWAAAQETAEIPEELKGGAAMPAPVDTITSKDGRTIRGTIETYEEWGVTMRREDGQIVNVAFELMSPGDMQKYRDRYNYQQR